MRKLLLSTTALAAAGALFANSAVADVAISGHYEWKYNARGSNQTALDGSTMTSDSEIHFKFTNKTDSGLTVGLVSEMFADSGDTAIDESSISIAGGFGKIVLGQNDGVGDNYGLAAADLIAEENSPSVVSATIQTNSDIAQGDGNANKIAYHLPAMSGLTLGVSYADQGAATGLDSTAFGGRYTMDMGGNAVTIGAASQTSKTAASTDTDSQNVGVKVVSGATSFIVSTGSSTAVDEDLSSNGMAVSHTLASGTVIGVYSFKSEDDLDIGEEYKKTGAEIQYTIASGLKAYINVDDYEYKAGTSETTTSDSGTMSTLTIKATF
jgi:hypothetical protein